MPNLTKAYVDAAIARGNGIEPRQDATVQRKSTRRVAGGRKAQRAGNHLEMVISSSAGVNGCGPVVLGKLPPCGGRYVGKGKFVVQDIPCDYMGCTQNGRGVFMDAKSCGEKEKGMRIYSSITKPHQIAFLIRMDALGCIAGLLVESKVRRQYFWLRGAYLGGRETIGWDDQRWVALGSTDKLIDFTPLLTTGFIFSETFDGTHAHDSMARRAISKLPTDCRRKIGGWPARVGGGRRAIPAGDHAIR